MSRYDFSARFNSLPSGKGDYSAEVLVVDLLLSAVLFSGFLAGGVLVFFLLAAMRNIASYQDAVCGAAG